jgi:acylglycerol lipase
MHRFAGRFEEAFMTEAFQNVATEERIDGGGGLGLLIRSWRPDNGIRGAVVIVPGFNAHSGYYSWVAQQLVAGEFAVYAVDLRGRGLSDGERYYVESFSDYVSDVGRVMAFAKCREEGLPVFLLGHSAGGVISCLYALAHPSELSGLICESFAFQIPAPDFALAVLKEVSHLAPHAHVLHLKNEDFSRDPKAVQAMNDDPLIAHETQPTRTVAELVRADERLKNEFPLITLPLLILHGTGDKAAESRGSQVFYDKAGSADKTLKLYEGRYHDLLNDLGKEAVMADIKSWLSAHVSAVEAAVSGS